MSKSEAMEWIEWIDGCEMQDMRHAGRRMYTVSCQQTYCMERTLWHTVVRKVLCTFHWNYQTLQCYYTKI